MGEKYEVPPLSAGEFWNDVFSGGNEDGSGIGKREGRAVVEG
jgi:hypothetical protein